MMTTKVIEQLLLNACYQLALIETTALHEHVELCDRRLHQAEAYGPLFDPSGYINSESAIKDARNQLAIAKHLLAAREAIDKREKERLECIS